MIELFWVIVLVVFALAGYVIMAYNGLVRGRNQTKEAWSDIDIQLKRRHNLIPNLVNTVKGYASHEKGTLESVTNARSKALSAGSPEEKAEAENMLSSTLKSLFAISENYPELKANANFLELQRELSDTENKIQSSRRFYNGNARDYNTSLESFPTNVIASMFSFEKVEFFQLESEQEKAVPEVSF